VVFALKVFDVKVLRAADCISERARAPTFKLLCVCFFFKQILCMYGQSVHLCERNCLHMHGGMCKTCVFVCVIYSSTWGLRAGLSLFIWMIRR